MSASVRLWLPEKTLFWLHSWGACSSGGDGQTGSGPDVVTHGVSPQDPAAEARMKVACITEQVLTLVNKRLGLYRHFDETVNRYKQSRDVSTLNSGRKSLETEHKALTSEVALLQSRLKAEGSDLCDKVSARRRRRAPGLMPPRSTWPTAWDTPARRWLGGRALPLSSRAARAPRGCEIWGLGACTALSTWPLWSAAPPAAWAVRRSTDFE